jgi:cytochrome c-type biogenesis protein CcmH/NrfF
METPPVDQQTVVVVVLGPAIVLALVGALIYWLRNRRPPSKPESP